jgi:hypothetical protein
VPEGQIDIQVDSFSMVSSVENGESVDQDENQAQELGLWDPVVLALPAALVNFMLHQIQLQEIDDDVLMEEMEVANPNFYWGGDNLQVGMALLPTSLDVYHVLLAKQ